MCKSFLDFPLQLQKAKSIESICLHFLNLTALSLLHLDRMKASYTLQKIDLTCPMQGESEGEVGSEDICRITTSSTSVAFCQNVRL